MLTSNTNLEMNWEMREYVVTSWCNPNREVINQYKILISPFYTHLAISITWPPVHNIITPISFRIITLPYFCSISNAAFQAKLPLAHPHTKTCVENIEDCVPWNLPPLWQAFKSFQPHLQIFTSSLRSISPSVWPFQHNKRLIVHQCAVWSFIFQQGLQQ